MVRRPLRPSLNVHEALEKLKTGRDGALNVAHSVKFGSAQHVAAGSVTAAIDTLAEQLTGDPEYFHLKPHSGPRHHVSQK